MSQSSARPQPDDAALLPGVAGSRCPRTGGCCLRDRRVEDRIVVGDSGDLASREQLLSRVWGYDFDPGSNVVDVYVGYLRRKLGNNTIDGARDGLSLRGRP